MTAAPLLSEELGADGARNRWFLSASERCNAATDIRPWTTGNRVEPLIDGAVYFASLYRALSAAGSGDQVYGSIWRSQPDWLDQTEGANADLVRTEQERFAIYDIENTAGNPVYVHAKVVVIDDVWAMIGSDNLNRRSWTHDSELSCAVLDAGLDLGEPTDPTGCGDNARVFARDLRLQLCRKHFDRPTDDLVDDLLDPAEAFARLRHTAETPQAWYDAGCVGPRPPRRLRPHHRERLPRMHRPWAIPVYRWLYDPDGRAIRDRIRHRP